MSADIAILSCVIFASAALVCSAIDFHRREVTERLDQIRNQIARVAK